MGNLRWRLVRSGGHPPPRTLSNREISRRRPRSPQLARSCGCVSVSAETFSGLKAILGGLSLGRGIPFPRCRSILDEDWSECGWLPHGKTKNLALTGPFRGQVAEAGHPQSVSKTPIDGSLNEIGCEEGKRDCLVD